MSLQSCAKLAVCYSQWLSGTNYDHHFEQNCRNFVKKDSIEAYIDYLAYQDAEGRRIYNKFVELGPKPQLSVDDMKWMQKVFQEWGKYELPPLEAA